MNVLPSSILKEIILRLETDVGLFPAGGVVRLFSNNFTPTAASVLGDFTETLNADVPGYVASAQGWQGAPIRKADGSWEDQGAAPNAFAATGACAGANVAYGWFLTDAAKTKLYASGTLPQPFTFLQAGDGFTLEEVINAAQVNGTDVTLHQDFEME